MKIIKKTSKKQLFWLAFVLVTVVVCLSYYSIQQIKKQSELSYERKGYGLIQLAKYGTLDKAIQSRLEVSRIKNYPWQD